MESLIQKTWVNLSIDLIRFILFFLQYSISYFIFINYKVIAFNRLLDKINEIIKFSILSQISKNEL